MYLELATFHLQPSMSGISIVIIMIIVVHDSQPTVFANNSPVLELQGPNSPDD